MQMMMDHLTEAGTGDQIVESHFDNNVEEMMNQEDNLFDDV